MPDFSNLKKTALTQLKMNMEHRLEQLSGLAQSASTLIPKLPQEVRQWVSQLDALDPKVVVHVWNLLHPRVEGFQLKLQNLSMHQITAYLVPKLITRSHILPMTQNVILVFAESCSRILLEKSLDTQKFQVHLLETHSKFSHPMSRQQMRLECQLSEYDLSYGISTAAQQNHARFETHAQVYNAENQLIASIALRWEIRHTMHPALTAQQP